MSYQPVPGPPSGPPAFGGSPEYGGVPQYASATGYPGSPIRRSVDLRRGLLLGGVIGGIALCGITVLVYLGWRMGPRAFGVGLTAAILPVPILVFCFLWLGQYHPLPNKYVALAFCWGAGVATGVSLVVNTLCSEWFAHAGLRDELVAVLVAPVIEEASKAAGPLLLFIVRRRIFNSVLDPVVLCGLSAVGFALVENILYLGGLGYLEGTQHGGELVGASWVVRTFLMRIGMSGFAHPLFTVMTGLGIGLAVWTAERRIRVLAPLTGLLAAMALHGAWNSMSVLTALKQQLYIMLYGYFAFMVPVFFSAVAALLWLRSTPSRRIGLSLDAYVRAGWLSPPEVESLRTLGRRASARAWAKRAAGDFGAAAMRAFQRDAARLALLRDRLDRGVGWPTPEDLIRFQADERALLESLVACRQVFAGRDPRMPATVWDGARYHITFPDNQVRVVGAPEQPVVPLPVTFVPWGAAVYR